MKSPMATRELLQDDKEKIWYHWINGLKNWRDMTKTEKEVILEKFTKKNQSCD